VIEMSCYDMVPGDVYKVVDDMSVPCDCILLQGEVYMNEASLTGESIPI